MTTARGVHQVLAGAAPRDAITNHALEAQSVIRAMGLPSEIFAEDPHIAGELRGKIHGHQDWSHMTSAGDRAILHYSIDSPAFDEVAGVADAVALHYHNVTPPELLWRDAPALALQCRQGRRHLESFAGRIALGTADSRYNANEMLAAGLRVDGVVGIIRRRGAAPTRAARPTGPRERILFVGRGVPNKCQFDAILAIGSLVQVGRDVELRLAGSWGGNRAYLERCTRLIEHLGLEDRVKILHSVSDAQLADEYANADLFLCLSEHEGYCVPLLEAMEAELPIVGLAAGAVPETMGAAGILLPAKTPSLAAEAMAAVLNGAQRKVMAEGRARQLRYHAPEAASARLRQFIKDFTA